LKADEELIAHTYSSSRPPGTQHWGIEIPLTRIFWGPEIPLARIVSFSILLL